MTRLKQISFLTAAMAGGVIAQNEKCTGWPPAFPPTPTPTAAASATPTASVEPTIRQTPSPTATVTATPIFACSIPRITGACVEKPSPYTSTVYEKVKWAQRLAEEQGLAVNGKIENEEAYLNGVVKNLHSILVCAVDGRLGSHTSIDEVWIPLDGYSDHYDIISGDGYAITLLAARCQNAKKSAK